MNTPHARRLSFAHTAWWLQTQQHGYARLKLIKGSVTAPRASSKRSIVALDPETQHNLNLELPLNHGTFINDTFAEISIHTLMYRTLM